MKKLILVGFLAFGALGFSRFVNECQVTSKAKGSTYKIYFEGNGYKGLRLTKATLVSSDDSSDYDDSEGDD